MNDMIKYSEHKVVWTEDKVKRFWEWKARRYGIKWFCGEVGDGLLRLVKKYITIGPSVLDWGAGDLALCKLLAKSLRCVWYYDHTANTKALYTKPHCGKDGCGGPSYDTVFLVAVLEHVLAGDVAETLWNVADNMRMVGNVVVVVDYLEDMDESMVNCPDCGAVYHSLQHQTSWGIESLSSFMAAAGFESVACIVTDLQWYSGSFIKRIAFRIGSIVLGRKRPHLIYIGTKK